MKSSPLVTIITPTFNREAFLAETIDSVLSQDYPAIEYIVLDDGSTDDTMALLRRYEGKIHYESHPNMGETLTVNKGFRMARGEIICVVNSDDPLRPGAISAAVQAMQSHPDRLVAYPDWDEIGPRSELIRHHLLPDYDIMNMLTDFNVAMGPGTFFRREAIERYGFRDVKRKYTGDLAFWFRIALCEKPLHVSQRLATHRTHPEAASSTDRGPQMADELVWIFQEIYNDPGLPAEVRKIHRLAFCNVHFTAAVLCLAYPVSAIQHLMTAFCYHPPRFVRFFVQRLFKDSKKALRTFVCILLGLLFLLPKLFFRLCHGRASDIADAVSIESRFAFVSHILPPSWSGQAVVIGRLLRDLDPEQYCLISGQDNRQQDGRINPLPGRCHHLGTGKNLPKHRSFLRGTHIFLSIFQRGWKTARILRDEKCRSAVVGTGDLADLPATRLACFLSGTKFYAYYFDDYVYQWTGMIRPLARLFEWISFRRIEGLVVPNEHLWNEMKSRRNINAVIIRNPCEAIPDRRDLEEEETKEGDIRIAYTGAVYHVNFGAIRNLISALEALKRPEIKLHLYTAQPRDWLEKHGICGAHVVQHGHVSHPEVVKAQSSAHILLIPFDFHSPVPEVVRTSAPGKLGDYLACGTPILAHVPSDTFVKWYLTEHRCGVVVDRDDPEEVGQAILRLLEDRDLRQSIREQARKCARVDFDPREERRRFLDALGCSL